MTHARRQRAKRQPDHDAAVCTVASMARRSCSRPAMLIVGLVLVAGLASSACGGKNGSGSPVTPTTVVPQATSNNVAWPQTQRVEAIRQHLHDNGSGAEARSLFPDLEETFVDDGHGEAYDAQILPFRYYWSQSGGVTVTICAVGKTVLICPYYLDRLITPDEYSKCDVAEIYRGPDDPPPAGRPQ